MYTEKTLPIKVSGGWDPLDVLFNQYYDVEFIEDFGAFKKGEQFRSVSVNYGDGVVEAYDDEGGVVKSQSYMAKAIE